ncbi:hypothetical protein BROUX41_003113 [Berkeleyomyces rouxiae]
MSIPQNLIDPTVTKEYKVILSDALMGTTAKEIFTGVRYNHKPANPSENNGQGRLKPSIPGNHSSYNLLYSDNNGDYSYSGSRTNDDGQYVLYFNSTLEAFVLDKVDSTFHMNLKNTPTEGSETLEKKYAPLDSTNGSDTPIPKGPAKAANTKATTKATSTKATTNKGAVSKPVREPKRKAPSKKEKAATAPLILPTAPPEAVPEKAEEPPKVKKPTNEFEDDDDDDDDGGLTVEYPGADKQAPLTTMRPPTFLSGSFSDFVKQQAASQENDLYSDGDDEEGLFDPSDDEDAGGNPGATQNGAGQPFVTETMELVEEDEEEEDDDDAGMTGNAGPPAEEDQTGFFDLEAEFEREMAAELEEKQQSTVSEEVESDVSEAE